MSAKRVKTIRMVWLEAFDSVAKTGSYSEAAKALDVSQSTVTRYLIDLGEATGRILLTDDVPPELTADGERFLATARQVIDLLSEWTQPAV